MQRGRSTIYVRTGLASLGVLLHGRLELHGVDSEKLCRRALDDSLRSRNQWLDASRYEDALAFLVAAAWELSERFDPGQGQAFSTFAYSRLRLRVIDWLRQTDGRTRWVFSNRVHERERPELVSLDHHDPGGGGLGANSRRAVERF